ncbi:C-C chemokine receptor type 7-like [Oncorhynchus kisutch]|uniref:C-C chemokine receptor type 7-like n=1 Tax=Oncorhynchus kisutch TaxID=8019 RepID=UPI00099FFF5E|nr:C-C chemokine receptor type 7-like [Oncorhynchus kisutch]
MTDVYLLNVAVADLLFIVTLPLIIYNEKHDWSMGSVVCKAVRVVLAVMVAFIVYHLPYNVALLYHTVALFQQRECEVGKVILTTLTTTRSVAYFHWCLNPILYPFIGVKIRNHFRKILEDL